MPNATLTRRRSHTFSSPDLIFPARITIISRVADPGWSDPDLYFFLDVRDPVFLKGIFDFDVDLSLPGLRKRVDFTRIWM